MSSFWEPSKRRPLSTTVFVWNGYFSGLAGQRAFWELLGALKTEALVDYSLRMERLLLFGNTKKCNSLVFPLAFAVRNYEKVLQSRVPARFCCSEIRKSATVSCSRLLLLFGNTKKCNSLMFPLAFAVRKHEKVQQSRVPARFC